MRSSNDNLVMINERLNKAYGKLTKKKSKAEKREPVVVESKEMPDPSATGGSQTKHW